MKFLNISLSILFAAILFLALAALTIFAVQGRPPITWKVYQNKSYGFYLRYPSIFQIQDGRRVEFGRETSGVRLSHHSIPYPHPNPCDFKGNDPDDPLDVAKPLENVVDFDILLEIKDSKEMPTKTADDDFVSFGSLKGFRVQQAVEGCGNWAYYFKISPEKMLVVSQTWITELGGQVTDTPEYLKIPGIIKPAEEDKFFRAIISSFKMGK